jgi:hypothetical protein
MRRRVAFSGLVLILLGIGVIRFADVFRAKQTPPLSIPPGLLDLGEVWSTNNFQTIVPVTNTTSHPIKVSQMRTTCSCARVEPSAFELLPGATQPVSIRANLTGYAQDSEVAKSAAGSVFGIGIMPVFTSNNGPESRLQWSLTGRVHTALNLPHSIYFNRVDMDRDAVQRTFVVTPLIDVQGLEFESSSASAIAMAMGSRRDLKAPISVELTLNPLQKPGWFDDSLQVSAIAADGKRLPAQEIRLVGTVIADIDWSPKQFVFGAQQADKSLVSDLSIWSRSGTRFKLVEADGSTKLGDESLDIEIRPENVQEVRYVAKVRLKAQHHSGPVLTLVATSGALKHPLTISVPIQIQTIDASSVIEQPSQSN